MEKYPKRKLLRLQSYDYSAPGTYFITICTGERRCFLSKVTVGAIHESPAQSIILTRAGRIVQTMIKTLPKRYPCIQIDKHVIMPNHVHLLIRIEDKRAIHESPLQTELIDEGVGGRSLLDKAMGYLKMNSSRQIHSFSPDLVVWQRSYYDHIVRDEKEYGEIRDYIEFNPLRWAEDSLYAED